MCYFSNYLSIFFFLLAIVCYPDSPSFGKKSGEPSAIKQPVENSSLPTSAFSSPPEVSPLILRPLATKEKSARLSFLVDRKTLTLQVDQSTPKICSDIAKNFKSQSYTILKPDDREICVPRKNTPSKSACPDLEIGRAYVPAVAGKKGDTSNPPKSYAVDVTRNLEGYDLSDYANGMWLYTGEETVIDKESTKDVSGYLSGGGSLVRIVDKKKCLIKTPADKNLRIFRRYNIHIDTQTWQASYEDTPSFNAVIHMGDQLYFLEFNSSLGWNQFLSSSDHTGILTLEQIDLASGRLKKLCVFSAD